MFVDHAGQTVAIIDRLTGETREAYVFVAVLGASNYTYAGATWTRGLRDWISSHVRAFEFFQGCTRLVVPDNWKSGVKPAMLLRAGIESDVQRSGGALWRGHSAGAALPCPR